MLLDLCPFCIIFLLCANVVLCQIGNRYMRDYDSLVMAHVIFMNGEKTPELSSFKNYPNNHYKNSTYFPYGNGELTLKGKKRAYILGEDLFRRYGRFLGPVYYPGLIEALTPEDEWAQMMIQVVLAALFPPTKEYEITKYLFWQPVPYITIPGNRDRLLIVTKYCPKILELDPVEFDNKTVEFYNYVSEYVGEKIVDPVALLDVYNIIKMQQELGIAVPYWAKRIWPIPFQKNALRGLVEICKQRLPQLIGNLLHKIMNDTEAKIADDSEPKFFLYSGNELNIVGILAALKAYDGEVIPYASYISIEIHHMSDSYGVKVLIQTFETNSPPKIVSIPNCGTLCPVDTFKIVIDKFYIGDDFC